MYPGALLALVVGLVGEMATGAASGQGPARSVLSELLRRLRRPLRMAPMSLVAGLLAILAATQLAVPFSPVSPSERNLVVAAVALAAAGWLGLRVAWDRPGCVRLVLAGQVCWLVALLAPALLTQSLRPQVLGAVMVPIQLPLKAGAALLYLLCLPALLGLVWRPASDGGDEDGGGVGSARLFYWLPVCGLFTSLYFPPASADPVGLVLFAGVTLGAVAAAVGLGALLARRMRLIGVLYLRLAPASAALLLAAAAVIGALS